MMTSSQIAYRQLLETKRHNVATEQLTGKQIEVQSDTARYAADTSAAASRYSADRHYAGTVYASNQSAAASRYAAATSAAASRYATETSAGQAMFRTVTESDDRRARLAFDRETQRFLNSMEQKRYELSTLSTVAQTEQSHAQAKYLWQSVEESIQRMQIQAEDLGLRKEAQKYENALRVARTAESGSKALATTAGLIEKVFGAIASAGGVDIPVT